MNDVSAEVEARREALESAIEQSAGYLEPFRLARATDDLRAVKHRMELGMDLTVVALVGGTGSGKSTMANAISGLDFTDSGELRPTTERAAACAWGDGAEPMLDFLGVDDDRRFRKGSILTDEEPEFEGLVLLDLPDHDSIRVSHSVQVSQLMPVVDLLMWVLDPQKYADQRLHADYLQGLARRKDSMIVVLNQIDTVPFDQRDRIVEDVKKVLADDGLDGIPVITASALDHQGIDEIKIHIASAVSRDSINAVTARAEIAAIAGRLQDSVADSEAEISDESLQPVAQQLARAAGIGAVGSSMRASGESWREFALAKPEQPATSTVTAIRGTWLDSVASDLPPAWAKGVHDSVVGPEKLRRDIADAVAAVPVTKPSSTNSLILVWLGALLILAGIGTRVAAAFGSPILFSDSAASWIVAGVVILAGVWAIFMARSVRKSAAARAADRYEQAVEREILQALRTDLGEPAQIVLTQHRRTRQALAKAGA
ncbi:ATP-binding protein [Flaviflexus huanghaiensis]|uniref:ATP-binding protein n=1 Tax=Flaviflexus huanghaiensis TaxID=1111473 RepID=UPI0015FD6678|nr:ATP-binding protein [Flaviflexus huanghaiensis]